MKQHFSSAKDQNKLKWLHERIRKRISSETEETNLKGRETRRGADCERKKIIAYLEDFPFPLGHEMKANKLLSIIFERICR